MKAKNVYHADRELRPVGHTVGKSVQLDGAEIYDVLGQYLGYWPADNMPHRTRKELKAELAANWIPGFVTAQDW